MAAPKFTDIRSWLTSWFQTAINSEKISRSWCAVSYDSCLVSHRILLGQCLFPVIFYIFLNFSGLHLIYIYMIAKRLLLLCHILLHLIIEVCSFRLNRFINFYIVLRRVDTLEYHIHNWVRPQAIVVKYNTSYLFTFHTSLWFQVCQDFEVVNFVICSVVVRWLELWTCL